MRDLSLPAYMSVPLVRTLDAPSDGTTTTVTASDHLRTIVYVGRSAGVDRAFVVLPDPALVEGQEFDITCKATGGLGTARMGASVGFNVGPVDVPDPDSDPMTGSGDAGGTFGVDSWDGASDTDLAGGATLVSPDPLTGLHAHRWALPAGPVGKIRIVNPTVVGVPTDVALQLVVMDMSAGFDIVLGTVTGWTPGGGSLDATYDGSSPDEIVFTPTTPIADTTDIYVVAMTQVTGGAPAPITSLAFDSIEAHPTLEVADWYFGYNADPTSPPFTGDSLLGTGELNAPHDTARTHHSPDYAGTPYKTLCLRSDGETYIATGGPLRSEFVTYAPALDTGVFMGVNNASQALNAAEAELDAP